jgi:HAE1 family hydrophobic/amphiphilic exporter-1
MIPMMLAKGVGAAYNNATAGVILGGQLFSLLLTLLATPVFYTLFDDTIRRFQRSRAATAE